MNYFTTLSSTNKKTGPIPVVTASRTTCPEVCPFKGNGCYADHGPLAIHWDKVTSGERGTCLKDALQPIKTLPPGTVWRYGQAGDLPGEGNDIDKDGLSQIVAANRGKNGIAFTHKPMNKKNLGLVKEAVAGGLTINLSANSPYEADELVKTGLPVVTVLPVEYARSTARGGGWAETLSEYKARLRELPNKTPNGSRLAVCPATYTDTTCQACRVCSRADRNGAVVGFPAHGVRKRAVSEYVSTTSRRDECPTAQGPLN